MKRVRQLRVLAALTCCFVLFGCGQKGPLTMPKEPEQNQTTVSETPSGEAPPLSPGETR